MEEMWERDIIMRSAFLVKCPLTDIVDSKNRGKGQQIEGENKRVKVQKKQETEMLKEGDHSTSKKVSRVSLVYSAIGIVSKPREGRTTNTDIFVLKQVDILHYLISGVPGVFSLAEAMMWLSFLV